MQLINARTHQSIPVARQATPDDAVPVDNMPCLSRLDFRHLSSHLSQRKPGYYLILLRNELRHRSLRDKPVLID
jgi:hypothetical protein